MQDEVHWPIDVDVLGHVVADELEVPVAEVGDVGPVAGQQVVDADDRVAAVEQRFAQVRSNEPGRAGDDDSHAVSSTRRARCAADLRK